MKSYIFITTEGYTYSSDPSNLEPDIDNCQVVRFAKGNNENEAFENLIKENEYLSDTNFNEIICLELKYENYFDKSKYFYLKAF
ncbi:hypothetical protein NLC29_01315 [Candidatus Aminicenantes bacterium AH-873-B07]|nr:hypothetical protein [Candidatus Aminicenantes bacterium AH-873-B07]